MLGRTLEIPKYARFGGRLYLLEGVYLLKKDAKEVAEGKNERGRWTRITEGVEGWQLWVRV